LYSSLEYEQSRMISEFPAIWCRSTSSMMIYPDFPSTVLNPDLFGDIDLMH